MSKHGRHFSLPRVSWLSLNSELINSGSNHAFPKSLFHTEPMLLQFLLPHLFLHHHHCLPPISLPPPFPSHPPLLLLPPLLRPVVAHAEGGSGPWIRRHASAAAPSQLKPAAKKAESSTLVAASRSLFFFFLTKKPNKKSFPYHAWLQFRHNMWIIHKRYMGCPLLQRSSPLEM